MLVGVVMENQVITNKLTNKTNKSELKNRTENLLRGLQYHQLSTHLTTFSENVELYGNSRKIIGIWEGSDKKYTLPKVTPKVGDALVVKFEYPVSFSLCLP